MDKAQEIRNLLDKMFKAEQTPEGTARLSIVCDTFPDLLYVLSDAQDRYYQLRLKLTRDDGVVEYDTWGIVCFSKQELADLFLEATERDDLKPDMRLFDDVRQLAQRKDVSCLFLLDDPNSVGVHWVK
jgi:hypothetical protein